MSLPKVFVIGATGQQGGSVVRALLGSNKFAVNALVRDVSSPASQSLKTLGAKLIQGDWDDVLAIEEAAAGCAALFLNSYPSFTNPGAELRQAQNILTAAKSAGVKHVVYSSAVGVDRYETLVNPDPDSSMGVYFRNKRAIEEAVKNSGFETYTILRGTHFMTNFLLPSALFQFPELNKEGILLTSFTSETRIPLFDPRDFGSFVLAVLHDPTKCAGKGLDLAVEKLGMEEIAELMEKVSGKKVGVRFRTGEEIETQKGKNMISEVQVAIEKMDTWVDVEEAKAWGIPMTSFEAFLVKNKEALIQTIG